MVLGIGNDPISNAYQAFANPSQLTEQILVHRMGFEPMISAVKGQRPGPLDERCITSSTIPFA